MPGTSRSDAPATAASVRPRSTFSSVARTATRRSLGRVGTPSTWPIAATLTMSSGRDKLAAPSRPTRLRDLGRRRGTAHACKPDRSRRPMYSAPVLRRALTASSIDRWVGTRAPSLGYRRHKPVHLDDYPAATDGRTILTQLLRPNTHRNSVGRPFSMIGSGCRLMIDSPASSTKRLLSAGP
jgi:hypothetical protein